VPGNVTGYDGETRSRRESNDALPALPIYRHFRINRVITLLTTSCISTSSISYLASTMEATIPRALCDWLSEVLPMPRYHLAEIGGRACFTSISRGTPPRSRHRAPPKQPSPQVIIKRHYIVLEVVAYQQYPTMGHNTWCSTKCLYSCNAKSPWLGHCAYTLL
jgi:hypothetical protein